MRLWSNRCSVVMQAAMLLVSLFCRTAAADDFLVLSFGNTVVAINASGNLHLEVGNGQETKEFSKNQSAQGASLDQIKEFLAVGRALGYDVIFDHRSDCWPTGPKPPFCEYVRVSTSAPLLLSVISIQALSPISREMSPVASWLSKRRVLRKTPTEVSVLTGGGAQGGLDCSEDWPENCTYRLLIGNDALISIGLLVRDHGPENLKHIQKLATDLLDFYTRT